MLISLYRQYHYLLMTTVMHILSLSVMPDVLWQLQVFYVEIRDRVTGINIWRML